MKNKKLIIALIAFALVLTLTIASTYAYFTASISSEGAQQPVNVKTATIGIEYLHGPGVNTYDAENPNANQAITADWNAMVPFKVTNTGTVSQTFDVAWDEVTTNTIVGYANTLTQEANCTPNSAGCEDVRNDFMYRLVEVTEEVYESFESGTPPTIEYNDYENVISYKMINPIYGVDDGDKIVEDLFILAGDNRYYVLIVEFDYIEPGTSYYSLGDIERSSGEQDYQQGKQFIGNIKVENVRLTSEVPEWSYVQIDGTEEYMLTKYNGDFTQNTEYLTINPTGITSTQLEEYNELLGRHFDTTDTRGFSIIVPSEYDGKTITKTADFLLSSVLNFIEETDNYIEISKVEMAHLTSVTIEEGITSIGGNFAYASPIESLIIEGNTLVEIGAGAFIINNLTGVVNIPSSVTMIGEGAFHYSPNITALNFVGRNSLAGISGDTLFVKTSNPTVYIPITCDGVACS